MRLEHCYRMPSWLLISLVASVVLTVVANLVPRLFPSIGEKAEERFLREMEQQVQTGRRTRIILPWKTMLVVSVIGTLALNLLL